MTWVLDLANQRLSGDERVPLFGVMLYTDAHPNLKKVLRDDDYWKALSEISGPRWCIFSVRTHKGHYGYPELGPGQVGMMCQVWKEPEANKELLGLFGLGSTEKLPALVLFVVDQAHGVDRIVVPIREKTVDEAYDGLREVMNRVATALQGVADTTLRDPVVVLGAVTSALDAHKNRRRLARGYEILKEIRDWLPFM